MFYWIFSGILYVFVCFCMFKHINGSKFEKKKHLEAAAEVLSISAPTPSWRSNVGCYHSAPVTETTIKLHRSKNPNFAIKIHNYMQ